MAIPFFNQVIGKALMLNSSGRRQYQLFSPLLSTPSLLLLKAFSWEWESWEEDGLRRWDEFIRVINSFNLLELRRTPQRASILPHSPFFPTGCLLFSLSVNRRKKKKKASYLLALESPNNRSMLIQPCIKKTQEQEHLKGL